MDSQLIPYVPLTEYKEEHQSQNVRDVLMKYLYHWPLFLISITLCLVLAFFYLRYVDPVYNVQARILIKTQDNRGNPEAGLNELDFVSTSKVVENEMEVLKSRTLLRKVVNDLQLWASYEKIGRISNQELYKESPVKITFIEGAGPIHATGFTIIIKDHDRFILKEGKKETEVLFSSRLKNSYGVWKVDITNNLVNHIGATININISNPEAITGALLAGLNTAVVNKQATVVELSIKETVPERGKDVLNKLISVYNLAAVQEKNRVTESTLTFVDERLASLKKELTDIEKQVEGFKSSRGLTDIALQSNFFLENFRANDSRLNDINVQIQVIKGIEAYVNSPGATKPPATVGVDDPGLVRLVEQLGSLYLDRERLLATTPEGHPAFEPVNRQIRTTQQAVRDNINGIKSSLIATRNKLQSYNDRVETSIRKLPGQEREYINIKRQQSTKEELYIYLMKKREEAALSYASTLSDSRTVDSAFYGHPVAPKVPLIYAIAFIFGLALPAGIIFGRDILNNKIITSSEIENATSVPILGELVFQENSDSIVMFQKDCRIIAEQFRILRTNLQFLHVQDGSGRVTMLTSSMSGEGKSFVACNLGASLAASGRKTIILDFDLRNPTVFEYFDMPEKKGICSYLSGIASKDEIIEPVAGHENLFAIGTGRLPSNPAELLERKQVKEFIDWLRISFDEIVIDTPPVNLVADGMIVSKYCDVSLYVIRQAFTYKSHLKYIEQLNKGKKLQNLNIVFNGVRMGGKYGYKNGFDYTYYANQNSQKKLTMGTIHEVINRL